MNRPGTQPPQDTCRTCILQRGGFCCAEPVKAYHRPLDNAVVSFFPMVNLDENWCGKHLRDGWFSRLLLRFGLAT